MYATGQAVGVFLGGEGWVVGQWSSLSEVQALPSRTNYFLNKYPYLIHKKRNLTPLIYLNQC